MHVLSALCLKLSTVQCRDATTDNTSNALITNNNANTQITGYDVNMWNKTLTSLMIH